MTSGNSRISIRKANEDDLNDIKALADAHRHELGFVRRPALAQAVDRREILVAHDQETLVGFIEYHHRRDNQTTLYHVVVRPQYRYRGIGRRLMAVICAEAQGKRKTVLKLKCPEDLPANRFYAALGYQLVEIDTDRKRHLVTWRRILSM